MSSPIHHHHHHHLGRWCLSVFIWTGIAFHFSYLHSLRIPFLQFHSFKRERERVLDIAKQRESSWYCRRESSWYCRRERVLDIEGERDGDTGGARSSNQAKRWIGTGEENYSEKWPFPWLSQETFIPSNWRRPQFSSGTFFFPLSQFTTISLLVVNFYLIISLGLLICLFLLLLQDYQLDHIVWEWALAHPVSHLCSLYRNSVSCCCW